MEFIGRGVKRDLRWSRGVVQRGVGFSTGQSREVREVDSVCRKSERC